MADKDRYMHDTFSSESKDFDRMFSDFVNKKFSDGWKYKNCVYSTVGDRRYAYCLFKRI